jgi:hypothetical protein
MIASSAFRFSRPPLGGGGQGKSWEVNRGGCPYCTEDDACFVGFWASVLAVGREH